MKRFIAEKRQIICGITALFFSLGWVRGFVVYKLQLIIKLEVHVIDQSFLGEHCMLSKVRCNCFASSVWNGSKVSMHVCRMTLGTQDKLQI